MDTNRQLRRRFLTVSLVTGLTSLFLKFPAIVFSRLRSHPEGVIVHEGEGEQILTGRRGAPITIKFSKESHGIDSISFCTEDIVPGRKLRIHKHLFNDEIIFIHKGNGLFTLGSEVTEVKTGSVIFIPREVWHGLENIGSENLLMTFGYTPSGFEGYFRENGTPAGSSRKQRTEEDYALAREKYGMVYQ